VPIPQRDLQEQYFPKDVPLRAGYARVVNCGAYNGDTIRRLHDLHGRIQALACFEPDLENYQALAGFLAENHHRIAERVMAFPCGLFSHDTQLRFAGGSAFNSRICDQGDRSVVCVAMDHALPGFAATFVSMDVEGAELSVLQGARDIIGKNVPDLAVCVYHAPNQLWEIPMYLRKLHPGYRFFLRNYTSFVSETVLYATR